MGVSVYRERAFSVGDCIQCTAPNQELKIANRELGSIERIWPNGALTLKMENGREMSFDPQCHPHLDHGYAVTSYSGQGQTADRVLIHVDTEGRMTSSTTAWRMFPFHPGGGMLKYLPMIAAH
jgi:ATP-dependent exoDNAse (exonuclease V) alpha subunit